MSTTTTTTTLCGPQTCTKLKQLQEENQTLKAEITKLTRTLQHYQNPHTPPSRRLYKTTTHPTTKPKNQKRYPGRPKGHQGTTRQKEQSAFGAN